MNGRANLGAAQSRELLEQANDAQIAEMGDKVLQLKELTQSIGRQAKESNSILQNMMPEIDKAGNLLKGTVSHLKVMMQQKKWEAHVLHGGFCAMPLLPYVLPAGLGFSLWWKWWRQ